MAAAVSIRRASSPIRFILPAARRRNVDATGRGANRRMAGRSEFAERDGTGRRIAQIDGERVAVFSKSVIASHTAQRAYPRNEYVVERGRYMMAEAEIDQ